MVNYRQMTRERYIMIEGTKYMPAAEWAEKHGHQSSAARNLIYRGKLPEAIRIGRDWLVPVDTPWPADRRIGKDKSGKLGKRITKRNVDPEKT